MCLWSSAGCTQLLTLRAQLRQRGKMLSDVPPAGLLDNVCANTCMSDSSRSCSLRHIVLIASGRWQHSHTSSFKRHQTPRLAFTVHVTSVQGKCDVILCDSQMCHGECFIEDANIYCTLNNLPYSPLSNITIYHICVLTCCFSLIAGLYVFHSERNSAVRL